MRSDILSQYDNGVLHPVAFHSKSMVPAESELSYHIYDKELWDIIQCFEHWRPDLGGTELHIQMFTDQACETLTRRQANYLNILSKFGFQIIYKSGKINGKAASIRMVNLYQRVRLANQIDELCNEYRQAMAKGELTLHGTKLKDCEVVDGVLYKKKPSVGSGKYAYQATTLNSRSTGHLTPWYKSND